MPLLPRGLLPSQSSFFFQIACPLPPFPPALPASLLDRHPFISTPFDSRLSESCFLPTIPVETYVPIKFHFNLQQLHIQTEIVAP